MANNVYVVDQLVTGTATITITDDGTGSDWLSIQGTYGTQTDLRLAWDTDDLGNATEAMGLYFFPDNTAHRLVIEGQIENVRGSIGRDYIQGNELANILYGDQTTGGVGDADSLYGYDGRDTIFGGQGNDWIGGGNDDDLMAGNAGVDTINGGAGNDTVIGGGGADDLSGGSDARDMVSYAGSNAAVRVSITYGVSTSGRGGHAQGDEIFGFADVTGSDHADVLIDTVKNSIAFGYNANQFFGGAGNDTLRLGGGDDLGRGGEGDDQIWGEIGTDILYGDAGADVIRGGAGADQAYGGAGADRFVFANPAESTLAAAGRDRIQDFSRAAGDQIDLSLIDAALGRAGNNAFTWRGTQGFSGDAGQLRWTVSGANALVLGDLDGDGAADMSILVLGMANLRATDFVL